MARSPIHRLAVFAMALAACAPEPPATPPEPPSAKPPADPVAPETEPVASIDGVPIDLAAFNLRHRARMPELRAAARGHQDLAALRLKGEILDAMFVETLVARAAGQRGIAGDFDAQVDGLLGPDAPITDDENPFEIRIAPAFAGSGEPARLGAG